MEINKTELPRFKKTDKIYKVSPDLVRKKIYKHNREYSFNDFFNIYTPTGQVSGNAVFAKHEVPDVFKVIYIRVYRKGLKKVAEECFTSNSFVTIMFDEGIHFTQSPIYHNDCYMDGNVFFQSTEVVPSEEVTKMAEELKYFGYRTKYMNALNDLFGVACENDYGVDMNQGKKHKVKKAHKRFKRKNNKKRNKKK